MMLVKAAQQSVKMVPSQGAPGELYVLVLIYKEQYGQYQLLL